MKTINGLTTLEIRKAVDDFKFVKEMLNNKSYSQLINGDTFINKNEIEKIEGFKHIIHNNIAIPFYKVNEDEICLFDDQLRVNGEIKCLRWLQNQLGDLNIKEQKKFMETLDITPLNSYISNLLGAPVEFCKLFSSNKQGEPVMILQSDDLIEHVGIMKATLSSIVVNTFGYCSFGVDREGIQQFFIPEIHFSYTHKNGGSNGSGICKIVYDIHTKEWQVYDKHVFTTFFIGK
jgi:hypothetical protein